MHSRHTTLRQLRGFTLIELMITIVVIAILLAIAVPNFSRVVASNRVVSGANEFVAAINLARMEAIRRGREAGVCASSDGGTCTGNWDQGFIVYYMSDASPSTPVLLRSSNFNKKDTVASATLSHIKFDRRGVGSSEGSLLYKPVDVKYEDLQRCIRISAAGSTSVKAGPCS